MVESERRQHPRVPVQIDVAYDNDVFLVNASLRDLSVGGAHILTEAPLPVGTRLSLFFRSDDTSFDLSARVLRVTEEDPDEPEIAPSMAVKFLDLSSSDQETLSSLIERYLSSASVEEDLEETILEETAESPLPAVDGAPEAHASAEEAPQEEGARTDAAPHYAPTENPEELESTVEYEPALPLDAAPVAPEDSPAHLPQEAAEASPQALPDPFATVQISPGQSIDDLTTLRVENSPFAPPTEGVFSPEETIATMPEIPAVEVAAEAEEAREEESSTTRQSEKRGGRRKKKKS